MPRTPCSHHPLEKHVAVRVAHRGARASQQSAKLAAKLWAYLYLLLICRRSIATICEPSSAGGDATHAGGESRPPGQCRA